MFKHDFKLENYLLKLSTKNARILCKFRTGNFKLPIETGRWFNIERDDRIYHLNAIAMLVMSSITFSIIHLYLLKEMSTYLVIIQIEQVHFLFAIYSLPKKIHILLLRGSVIRVNIVLYTTSRTTTENTL